MMSERSDSRTGVLSWLAVCAALGVAGALPAQQFGTVDYSDTFTVAQQGGSADRPDGIFNSAPAYVVEDSHGNPASTWTPFNFFSFNTGLGSACCGYTTNDGNPGSASGLAQSGGGDYSFAYGLRSNYMVRLEGILPLDRLNISSLPAAGNSIFTSNSLSVFFRADSRGTGTIGLYNGAVETVATDDLSNPLVTGIAADDNSWHAFGVHFNQPANLLGIYVDDVLLAELDLTTFAGGIYQNYSNGAVGAGGAGYDFVTKVLWIDNFQVGAPVTTIDACFSASTTQGRAPLTVDFNAGCSTFAGTPLSYSWTFGDGGSANGETVSRTYNVGGSYEVTLTVTDTLLRTASTSKTITVFDTASSFTDNFDRADGLIDGWTVYSVPDTWNLLGGELVTGPTNEERWIWAGDPALIFPDKIVMEFDMRFLGLGTVAAVGRHAGAVFCGSVPTHRYDPAFSGYFIDWIDRSADHGFRFTRVTSGVLTELVLGAAGSPAEPPLVWRVELTNNKVRVFGDNVLYIDIVDATYRGGFAGLWTWAGGQELAFDEFTIAQNTEPITACFTVGGSEQPVSGTELTFDAACSEVLIPGAATYTWNFGDGSPATVGAQVSHAFASAGRFAVTLLVRDSTGNESTVTEEVTIYQKRVSFADDFERADGPITGWTEFSPGGGWTISNGELATGPSTREHWLWAGDTPIVFPDNVVVEWDQSFAGPGTNPVVGRHAGLAFCGSRPTHRYDPAFDGYFVDWIDRPDDRGLRLSRADNGSLTEIIRGAASIVVPDDVPLIWRLELEGDLIRLYGDDVLYFEVVDGTHRGGFVGFWTWEGGQEVHFDNVNITGDPLGACFTSAPALALAGSPVAFDASCSESFLNMITSYAWTFGDGGSANGLSVNHTYALAGDYRITLTITDSAGGSASLERTVTVFENLLPFADCFERAPGPVTGWTAASGDWNIAADGVAEVVTGGEAFLYAGSPARPMASDFVAEVDWELVVGTHPVVGRHAAVHFYWNGLTTNRFAAGSRGYSVFYIDRAGDRGLTLARWDLGGVLTVLNPPGGTPAVPDPPATLRIEVTGDRIVVFADGVSVIDVIDNTYRDGFFALWSWNDNTVRFDNVRIGLSELPVCEGGGAPRFVRGDTDADGAINLTDAVAVLLYLFSGGREPSCFDAADSDDNGQLQLTDAVRILNWLFIGGLAPQPPSPSLGQYPVSDCGVDPVTDPADPLGCAAFGPCP